MDALIVKDFCGKGTKYLNFSNQDGKQWSIPMKNTQVALELYEPSGIKGKMLKKLLPITARLGIAKRILHGSYTSVTMSEELKHIITDCFGDKWEFSVFWGTPCVDQKVTVQIYNKQRILGYCKLGDSYRVIELFQHEKRVLDFLQQKEMSHVPRCLALEHVSEQCWAFVQSTEKVRGTKTNHQYGEKHIRFLEELWIKTKKSMLFEETDYYKSLLHLEERLDLICETYRTIVQRALIKVKWYYSGKKVEWGGVHRDFTPWNTCLVNDELFIFDFEYALFHAPKGMDQWHYFVQTKVFEEKRNMYEIAEEYYKLRKKEDDVMFYCYLLDIISLYFLRGEESDKNIAMQRVELLSLVWNKCEVVK